jgi:hypothetical protein
MGQYLMLKEDGLSIVEHNERFFMWLKDNQGIRDHRHSIVQAIGERTNLMFGGSFYDEALYSTGKK